MNDKELIWERYLFLLKENTLNPKKEKSLIRPIEDFTEKEKLDILSKLSDVERAQLSTPVGGKSAKNYMSEDDWVQIRDYSLRKALERNPETNPDLCAYTPSETLTLLNNPIIQNWFKMVTRFKIPENKKRVIFVPCAASKRWIDNPKAKNYNCINMIRGESSDTYWVTISEPLGIIPEDHWNDFPFYDNPGLFHEGNFNLKTAEWKTLMNKDRSYAYPFDKQAKKRCIAILGGVIKSFYDFNKNLNPDLSFISAVETPSEKSTHSDMLDVSGILSKEQRYYTASGPQTKEQRMSHWQTLYSTPEKSQSLSASKPKKNTKS